MRFNKVGKHLQRGRNMNFLKKYWCRILSVWIAFVFVQSLFFKFTNSVETQHIFGVLGEWSGFDWFAAYGGYGVGIAELITSILLFTRFWPWGALMSFCIMSGAIFFHLFTPLGVAMPQFDANGMATGATDGGTLFILACTVWVSSAAILTRDWLSSQSQLRPLVPGFNH